MPLLRYAATGEPVYEPLLFGLLELRGVGSATNTLLQALRSIMLLLLVLDELKVDIERRLRDGKLLDHSELESVARACSLQLRDLREEGNKAPSPQRVINLREAARMRMRVKPLDEVQLSTKFVRLHYIHKYLMWLANRWLLRHDPATSEYQHLLVAKDVADKLLTARMPNAGKRNTEDQRQGLEPKDLERLLQVIQPDHPENPWSASARVRNNLLVRWYLRLGLRRAELLGVQVSDINFQACEVLIARRPDDKDDPRINKPDVKTSDKLLPLEPTLAQETHNYIVKVRRGTGNARRHPYLFVAIGTGAPLSLAAVNLVFMQLKRKVPGLPDDLSPHVLRHTWNDSFSELADKEGFTEAEERRMRSRLQGWSPTSETAANYTRRHVKKKAREASLSLQATLSPKGEIQ